MDWYCRISQELFIFGVVTPRKTCPGKTALDRISVKEEYKKKG